MKPTSNSKKKLRSPLMIVSILALFFASCNNESKKVDEPEPEAEDPVVKIVTEEMDFQMPDTLRSGWNTFEYANLSPQTHFFLIDDYPDGKTTKDAEELVAPVFERAMQLIMKGDTEKGYAEFANLPEWFSEVTFVGGSGLISPGETAYTTLKLEPGNYIIECYVKMSNGVFHTSMGMTKDIVVLEEDSGLKSPIADIDVMISSTEGIELNDSIRSGSQVLSVYYKDQITHENFVGHDVNLVRLDAEANIDSLEHWMNWANPKGLMDPSPEGVTFLGGVNDLPQGETGYFTADLEAGTYALISEVPEARKKNMFKKFVVSE